MPKIFIKKVSLTAYKIDKLILKGFPSFGYFFRSVFIVIKKNSTWKRFYLYQDMNKLAKTYRKDIDGLRFIAVFAVVINHLIIDFLPMGYLGVDIFFVISGYVISMSILNSQIISLRSFFSSTIWS